MTGNTAHGYLIAIGSNLRHPRIGSPRKIVAAALEQLADDGWQVEVVSPTTLSRPIGPSTREYANAAAVVSSRAAPPEALAALQAVEARFGRKRRGARWRARVLDLDIVLWSGGIWVSANLAIPHPAFRERPFVLHPAAAIAPDWRDPVSGRTLRQLAASLLRRPRKTP